MSNTEYSKTISTKQITNFVLKKDNWKIDDNMITQRIDDYHITSEEAIVYINKEEIEKDFDIETDNGHVNAIHTLYMILTSIDVENGYLIAKIDLNQRKCKYEDIKFVDLPIMIMQTNNEAQYEQNKKNMVL